MKTDLSKFDVGAYRAGPKIQVLLWYMVNYAVFNSSWPWPVRIKRVLLRLFGAQIGRGLIIKPKIRIKNPHRLRIGNHCWIGESAWIDNLEDVELGDNVCISQGAMLLTGNHDYTVSSFPYRLGKIKLEDGVWVGAQSVVCPGVTCHTHAILTVNSVATKDLDAFYIYSGNPAIKIRERKMQADPRPGDPQN